MKIIKEIIPYAIIILVIVLIRTFIVTPIRVDGESMYPTLKNNEILLLEKYKKDFKKDDIVVVKTNGEKIIKRIIGTPGDTVAYLNNVLFINGKATNDHFANLTEDFEAITLKDDEYFVLGDNRERSLDSRYIGPVKKSSITGTTRIRIIPLNKIGKIKVED